jgi:hypothetical protein
MRAANGLADHLGAPPRLSVDRVAAIPSQVLSGAERDDRGAPEFVSGEIHNVERLRRDRRSRSLNLNQGISAGAIPALFVLKLSPTIEMSLERAIAGASVFLDQRFEHLFARLA